jgi:hypothetical protein
MESCTPEQIAHTIFTKPPAESCSSLLNFVDTGLSVSDLFEVLLTIAMEGIDILSGGIDTVDVSEFTNDTMLALNPWLNSIAVKIHIEERDMDKNDHYCKIVLKNGDYSTWFEMKQINKS